MFSLKKNRLRANTATTFKHVKDCHKDVRGWVKHHEKLSTNKGKWSTGIGGAWDVWLSSRKVLKFGKLLENGSACAP